MSVEDYRLSEQFPHQVRLPSPEGFPAIRHQVLGRGSALFDDGTEVLIFAGHLPHLDGEPEPIPQSGGPETRVLVRRNGNPNKIEEVIKMQRRKLFPNK